MTTDLGGKTALVTGAGRGIGAAIATDLSRAGADVVLVSRTAEELGRVAAAIRKAVPGATVRALTADLAQDDQRSAMVDALLAYGGIDVLINNAATVEPLGASLTIAPKQLRLAFEINVVAPGALTVALAPAMITMGWGRIVNVSSSVVAHPGSMIGGNAYATTKAALEIHTLNLAAELDGTGVTVNVYRPGGVDTAMQGWIRAQDPGRIGARLHERFVSRYGSGALISPEQSSAALLGHLLGADGARTGAIWDLADTLSR